jgi:hypothetical protein
MTTAPSSQSLQSLPARVLVKLQTLARLSPPANPAAYLELLREHLGGFPVDPDHRPHLLEALGWLERAQDATPDQGFARSYSIAWDPYFQSRGWQPSYPETTGYLIPTLYEAAHHLDRPDLADRATRAAYWETEVQLPSGAVQGGVIGQGRSPASFNTGQVIFGWLRAFEVTRDHRLADSARRAGRYLVSCLSDDGTWSSGQSRFALPNATLYNARTSWALAEAGIRLGEPEFTRLAGRSLRVVAARQADNGWFPDCCLTDPTQPLLHTVAYTVRGLLEGGRVLADDDLIDAAERSAAALVRTVRADGWMPGRYAADWSATVRWSCLTGQAQMVNNWIRLFLIRGDSKWLEPVPRVLRFLKATQNRLHPNPGIRGGLKGSWPVNGEYGRFQILNWATKFFADALMRDEQVAAGEATARSAEYSLA